MDAVAFSLIEAAPLVRLNATALFLNGVRIMARRWQKRQPEGQSRRESPGKEKLRTNMDKGVKGLRLQQVLLPRDFSSEALEKL